MFRENYLDELLRILGEDDEDSIAMVEYLRSIRILYYTCVKRELDQTNFSYTTDVANFRSSFEEVHKRWQVKETLKIHILREHILEFFIDTQETMNTTNDQGPEAKLYDNRHTEEEHGLVMKQVTKGKVKAKKKKTLHKLSLIHI